MGTAVGTANVSELVHTGRGPAWPPINFKRLYYVVCHSGCTQEQGKVTARVNGPAPVIADILTNGFAISQIKGYAPKCDTGFLLVVDIKDTVHSSFGEVIFQLVGKNTDGTFCDLF